MKRLNKKEKFKIRIALIIYIFLILLFFLWGIVRSYTTLEIENCCIYTDKLLSEISLVLISDLHNHEFGENNSELIDMVTQKKPDIILMAGDFLNDDADDEDILLKLVKKLSIIAPTYFSLGNHEINYINQTGIDLCVKIEKAGAKVLELCYDDIEVNGETIRIGGMYDYAFGFQWSGITDSLEEKRTIYQFLTDFQNSDNFKLMMAHRPDSFIFGEASKTWDIDLVVSGHAHGGQVVMPFLGGLWAPDQGWFPEYVHGLHEKDKLNIFITSGLGSQPEVAPRFNNPPEVAVITLAPEE